VIARLAGTVGDPGSGGRRCAPAFQIDAAQRRHACAEARRGCRRVSGATLLMARRGMTHAQTGARDHNRLRLSSILNCNGISFSLNLLCNDVSFCYRSRN